MEKNYSFHMLKSQGGKKYGQIFMRARVTFLLSGHVLETICKNSSQMKKKFACVLFYFYYVFFKNLSYLFYLLGYKGKVK